MDWTGAFLVAAIPLALIWVVLFLLPSLADQRSRSKDRKMERTRRRQFAELKRAKVRES